MMRKLTVILIVGLMVIVGLGLTGLAPGPFRDFF